MERGAGWGRRCWKQCMTCEQPTSACMQRRRRLPPGKPPPVQGINLRGDINVAIVGDPACAKSQMLK